MLIIGITLQFFAATAQAQSNPVLSVVATQCPCALILDSAPNGVSGGWFQFTPTNRPDSLAVVPGWNFVSNSNLTSIRELQYVEFAFTDLAQLIEPGATNVTLLTFDTSSTIGPVELIRYLIDDDNGDILIQSP